MTFRIKDFRDFRDFRDFQDFRSLGNKINYSVAETNNDLKTEINRSGRD